MYFSDKIFNESVLKKLLYLLGFMVVVYCCINTGFSYLILIMGYVIVAVKKRLNVSSVGFSYCLFLMLTGLSLDAKFMTIIAIIFSLVYPIYDRKNLKYFVVAFILYIGFAFIDMGYLNFKANTIKELGVKEKQFEMIKEHWTDDSFYKQALENTDISSFKLTKQ